LFIQHFDLPMPRCQHVIASASGEFLARVDFAYPDLKVAIEVDGYRFHSSRSDWERDRVRLSKIAAEGWRTLHITSTDIDKRSAIAADRIRTAIAGMQGSFR
jgi:very-short-patch-repair endonuclease